MESTLTLQPANQQSRQSKNLILLCGIFITILLGVIGFLTYQNSQLNIRLTFLEGQGYQDFIIRKYAPTPTPGASTETTEWQTYSDEHITFQYPQEWQIGQQFIYGSGSVTDFSTPEGGKPFYLHYYANNNQATGSPYELIDEFVANIRPEYGKFKYTEEMRQIDNYYPAIYTSDEGDPGHSSPYEAVYVFSPDEQVVINLYCQPGFVNTEGSDTLFARIVSTVKLTN